VKITLTSLLCLLAATLNGCDDESSDGLVNDAATVNGGSTTDASGTDAPVASPIDLGAGYNATVTLDAVGTGYISWIGAEPTITSLHFCALPRGATDCSVRTTLATEGTSLSRPFVVVNGTTVKVLSYRYGLATPDFAAVFLFTSLDGGRTFGAGRKVGKTPFSAAVLGPGDGVSLTTHAHQNGLALPTRAPGRNTRAHHRSHPIYHAHLQRCGGSLSGHNAGCCFCFRRWGSAGTNVRWRK